MFFFTSTADSPWIIIKSDDKKRARINAIRCLLSKIDYPEKRERPADDRQAHRAHGPGRDRGGRLSLQRGIRTDVHADKTLKRMSRGPADARNGRAQWKWPSPGAVRPPGRGPGGDGEGQGEGGEGRGADRAVAGGGPGKDRSGAGGYFRRREASQGSQGPGREGDGRCPGDGRAGAERDPERDRRVSQVRTEEIEKARKAAMREADKKIADATAELEMEARATGRDRRGPGGDRALPGQDGGGPGPDRSGPRPGERQGARETRPLPSRRRKEAQAKLDAAVERRAKEALDRAQQVAGASASPSDTRRVGAPGPAGPSSGTGQARAASRGSRPRRAWSPGPSPRSVPRQGP